MKLVNKPCGFLAVEKYLRNWTKNQMEKCNFLDAKYNRLMPPQNGILLGYLLGSMFFMQNLI